MSFLSKLLGRGASSPPPLDYDRLFRLDAEDLAEQGIREGYERLLPELRVFVSDPADVEEALDPDTESYAVSSGEFEFIVYSPTLPGSDRESWGRATYAFYTIVNNQLAGAGVLLYAVNGGNDLSGIFLTPAEVEAAKGALSAKSDWPYLPRLEAPYYGQHH